MGRRVKSAYGADRPMGTPLATGSDSLHGPASAGGKAGSLALAFALALAFTGTPVIAAPREAALRAPEAAPPPSCSREEQPALTELACELARDLGAPGGTVAVGAAPPTSDRTLRNEAALAERLARRVAAALGPNTEAIGAELSLAEARRAGKRAQTLVYLSLAVAGGEVRVTAVAEPTTLGFWDRVRGKAAGVRRQAFATRRIDAEVATFLPVVPLSASRVEKAQISTTDVVAVACGDADGDSSLEVLLVGRRKIQLGRVRAKAFVPHAEVAWASLSPIAPSPLREPIAAAGFVTARGILVGSTDRKNGLWLTPELKKKQDLRHAVLPFAGVGCVEREGVSLTGLYDCFTSSELLEERAIVNADAVAGAVVVDEDGKARRIKAVRSAADGALSLDDGMTMEARVARVGGAIAVADVNLDGAPELVASTDARVAKEDALVVSSWGDAGVHERYRVPVPEGIRAVAVCPPEDGGPRPIVVATPYHLYVVR